jgi:hypothetical protein
LPATFAAFVTNLSFIGPSFSISAFKSELQTKFSLTSVSYCRRRFLGRLFGKIKVVRKIVVALVKSLVPVLNAFILLFSGTAVCESLPGICFNLMSHGICLRVRDEGIESAEVSFVHVGNSCKSGSMTYNLSVAVNVFSFPEAQLI